MYGSMYVARYPGLNLLQHIAVHIHTAGIYRIPNRETNIFSLVVNMLRSRSESPETHCALNDRFWLVYGLWDDTF